MTSVNAFIDWLHRALTEPLRTPMSPLGVFALIGIVIVSIIMWNMILYHIRMTAQDIV